MYGGTASPSPSFPQTIHNVSGNNNIKIQNKNLMNTSILYEEMYNYNSTDLSRVVVDNKNCISFKNNIYSSAELYKIPYKENTSYTFRVMARIEDTTITSGYTLYLRVVYSDGTRKQVSVQASGSNWQEVRLVSNSSKTVKSINWSYGSGASWLIDEDSFNIIEGDTTSYVSHQEQNLPITLGNIELNKIGTAQDYFYKENNKWYLHKETNKKAITNVSSVNIASTGIKYAYIGVFSNIKSNSFIYCEKYINSTTATKNNSIRLAGNQLYIYDNRFTDVETALSLLNGLEYYHIMTTPTDTEITDTTLIEQLEALLQAFSYLDETNISGTSSDLEPIIDATAIRSLNDILTRLEVLESEV